MVHIGVCICIYACVCAYVREVDCGKGLQIFATRRAKEDSFDPTVNQSVAMDGYDARSMCVVFSNHSLINREYCWPLFRGVSLTTYFGHLLRTLHTYEMRQTVLNICTCRKKKTEFKKINIFLFYKLN